MNRLHQFFLVPGKSWDHSINDDYIVEKAKILTTVLPAGYETLLSDVLAPIGTNQELWISGVTYNRNIVRRQEKAR